MFMSKKNLYTAEWILYCDFQSTLNLKKALKRSFSKHKLELRFINTVTVCLNFMELRKKLIDSLHFSHGENSVNFVLVKLLQTLCHFWNFWSAWCCDYVGTIWSTWNILQNFQLFQYVFKPKLLRDILLHCNIPENLVRRFFFIRDLKFLVAAFLLASLNF